MYRLVGLVWALDSLTPCWVTGSVSHGTADALSPSLLVILALAGLVSAGLAGLALAAFLRRRSRPYLFIVLAIGALVARTVVATGAAANLVTPATHHLVEHALDVVMAALVVGAVYYARTVDATATSRER